MEHPATWNILTASLAVGDLQMPDKVWAFLVVQGLVRDVPGDREFFHGIIRQEKSIGEITGPSLQSRIAGRLRELGIATLAGAEPDANAAMAKQRWQALNHLLNAKESFQAARNSFHCTHCGVEVDKQQHPSVCPACHKTFHDVSTTCVKLCQQCKTLNPLAAIFCHRCGQEFRGRDHLISENRLDFFTEQTFPQVRNYCAFCGDQNQFGYKFCRRCGASATDGYLASSPYVRGTTEPIHRQEQGSTSRTAPQSDVWQTRLFRLIAEAEHSEFSEDLWFVISSLIQDFTVMKELLKEKGVSDDELYKKLRLERMIYDHSSAGATPWKGYSHYPYTLDENDFLRQILKASEEEVKEFEEQVETVMQQT